MASCLILMMSADSLKGQTNKFSKAEYQVRLSRFTAFLDCQSTLFAFRQPIHMQDALAGGVECEHGHQPRHDDEALREKWV